MITKLYNEPVFRISGDQGVIMEFGDIISPRIHEMVRTMILAMNQNPIDGVVEYMPTYRAIAIYYNPLITSFESLKDSLLELSANLQEIEPVSPKLIELPVCYGGEFGPDLDFVATSHGLSQEEVIRLHSEPEYLVYMIGFTPGYPFLGGLPEVLHTPRLDTPRKKVPAGSVGIANGQTGIYPIESPGGWQLIGQVPVKLFDPEKNDPFLFSAGNIIKFKSVDKQEYMTIRQNN